MSLEKRSSCSIPETSGDVYKLEKENSGIPIIVSLKENEAKFCLLNSMNNLENVPSKRRVVDAVAQGRKMIVIIGITCDTGCRGHGKLGSGTRGRWRGTCCLIAEPYETIIHMGTEFREGKRNGSSNGGLAADYQPEQQEQNR
jgi:hypothetical protein